MTDFYTRFCILKQYVVLVEVYKENSVSHKYVDRKENYFLDNWEHCFWYYPKIQHVVVSSNLSGVWKISKVFILRYINPSVFLNSLNASSYAWFWTLCIGHVENMDSLSYKALPKIAFLCAKPTHFIKKDQKINLLIISIASNRALETIKFMVADISFSQY